MHAVIIWHWSGDVPVGRILRTDSKSTFLLDCQSTRLGSVAYGQRPSTNRPKQRDHCWWLHGKKQSPHTHTPTHTHTQRTVPPFPFPAVVRLLLSSFLSGILLYATPTLMAPLSPYSLVTTLVTVALCSATLPPLMRYTRIISTQRRSDTHARITTSASVLPGHYHVTAIISMHWRCSDSCTHVRPPLISTSPLSLDLRVGPHKSDHWLLIIMWSHYYCRSPCS